MRYFVDLPVGLPNILDAKENILEHALNNGW